MPDPATAPRPAPRRRHLFVLPDPTHAAAAAAAAAAASAAADQQQQQPKAPRRPAREAILADHLFTVWKVHGATGLIGRFGVRQVLDACYAFMVADDHGAAKYRIAPRVRKPAAMLVWYLEHGGGVPRR